MEADPVRLQDRHAAAVASAHAMAEPERTPLRFPGQNDWIESPGAKMSGFQNGRAFQFTSSREA